MTLEFELNGNTQRCSPAEGVTLLELLREDFGLLGAKLGCGEGQCGSCTVLLDGRGVRACITRAASVSGRKVITIEGLAKPGGMHPLQQAFIDRQAFQCGFCTPGMIMGAAGLLNANPSPAPREIAAGLDGHICRCGTYPRIVEAVRLAAQVMKKEVRRG
jgi:aerobic-type carbon monoxide dehydrogenase small subunit (CoxS/CutS family)